jgi:uroporphyrin-3 C-methyltransferase
MMNDTTSNPSSPRASDANSPTNENGFTASRRARLGGPARRDLLVAALALLAIGLIALWWFVRSETGDVRREVAQRLQSGDSANTETRIVAKSLQESVKELQAKVAVLEGKQVEGQTQQLALEQLYQDLSKNRDDWALAEIEQVLSTASQQLQLAGNVRGALIALQNADSRLSRSDKPQFIVIRRAVARDIERLKALPTVDLTGLALRLDSVIGQIDGMPLLADEQPSAPVEQPRQTRKAAPIPAASRSAANNAAGATGKAATDNAATRNDWIANIENTWQSWSSEIWGEVRQLIRVRTVNTPDALLLSPGQAYYARENLKLRLLNARLALLSRNESAFRSDLLAAQDTIARYFDTRARQTQTAQALLKQVQASNLSIEMPVLSDSLDAVRNYKAKVQ